MQYKPQLKIPATYMRGGTSKGVFFNLADLPEVAQVAGPARDKLLLRVIGSPDPYGKHTDGMGGATSSTSKAVIISKSTIADHDVDYLFGQVALDKAFIDWGGNCGNLTAAVGAFAIHQGLVDASRIPDNGIAKVRIWQANIQKTIIAHIPISDGQVQEAGDFILDGVCFPAAEIQVDFLNPVDESERMFPTGNVRDILEVPDIGSFNATFINAGIPTIFLNADELIFNGKALAGTELQPDINAHSELLAMFEKIRAHGAVQMGVIKELAEAKTSQHTPKIAFVSKPASFTASSGKLVQASDIDFNVRALSMGQLHHAMMGTAAVAIAFAAVIPDTLVNAVATGGDSRKPLESVCFGHPSGTMKVGAKAEFHDDQWLAKQASMSRSARRLMEGWVRIPDIL